jgi:hypothetical protein
VKHKHHDVSWSPEDDIVSQGHPQSEASQLSVPRNQNFYERNNSLLANVSLTDTTSKVEPGLNPLENTHIGTLCCKVHCFSL